MPFWWILSICILYRALHKAALVQKKDGPIKLHGDYRITVNAALRGSCNFLPVTSEVLANLRGCTVLWVPGLFQAYQKLKVTKETAAVLTINTIKGLYNMKQPQFGIFAAPTIFQRLRENTAAEIPGMSMHLNGIIVSVPDQQSTYFVWTYAINAREGRHATATRKLGKLVCVWYRP